jgi:hypothetical protein
MMSVSSVSSYSSTLWEEYLEQLRKKQQQGSDSALASSPSGVTAAQSALSAETIISELQSLQDDPEKLKARAAELAVEVASEAENSVGIKARMLEELASDLETTAESGDLSLMQEKLSRARGGAGPRPNGPSDISSKLAEALVEEDEDTSAATLDNIMSLLTEIQSLLKKEEESSKSSAQTASGLTPEQILADLESLQDDPEKLKAGASELASQLKSEAGAQDGRRAQMLEALASDVEYVASSGDLSALKEKISRGRPAPAPQNTSIEFGALVSKFQSITETAAAGTPDESTLEAADDAGSAANSSTSADSLVSKLKSNLTDKLRALYAQGQRNTSSVSLSG